MSIFKLFSIILHPVFMPLLGLYMSITCVPAIKISVNQHLHLIYSVVLISSILLPLILIFFLVKKNIVSSFEMPIAIERPLPLIISGCYMFLGYLILEPFLIFSEVLKNQFLGAIIIVFFSGIVSRFWKISLHMLGVGGIVGVLVVLQLIYKNVFILLVVCFLLSGLLGASRIQEKAHTESQIYVSFIIGFLIEFFVMLN